MNDDWQPVRGSLNTSLYPKTSNKVWDLVWSLVASTSIFNSIVTSISDVRDLLEQEINNEQ